MTEQPAFRKPDRYKASSYRSYNFKMPSRYDTCVWHRLCQTPLWDRIVIQTLGPDLSKLRILDAGCATGRLLEQLALAGATRLAGADLAPRILDVARKKLERIAVVADLRAADVEDRLPWDDGSFEAVTMTGVLHHLFRPKEALAEVRRVLSPGGRVLVVDPNFFSPLRQIFNAALRIAPHAGDCRFYAPSEARALVSDLGFEVRTTRRVGLWAFLVEGIEPKDR